MSMDEAHCTLRISGGGPCGAYRGGLKTVLRHISRLVFEVLTAHRRQWQ